MGRHQGGLTGRTRDTEGALAKGQAQGASVGVFRSSLVLLHGHENMVAAFPRQSPVYIREHREEAK